MRVVGIARQAAAGLHRLGAAGEDRHAVPALLPVPDRAVTGGAERGGRKFVIGRLQLLQADDVRRGLLQPPQQVGKPPVDAVDVVGRDPHPIVQLLPKLSIRRRRPAPPKPQDRNAAEQIRQTLRNMAHMLDLAGSGLDRIVKMTVVLADAGDLR